MRWIKADSELSGYANVYQAGLRNAEYFAEKNHFFSKKLFDTSISTALKTANELVNSSSFASYSADRGNYPMNAVIKYTEYLRRTYSLSCDVKEKRSGTVPFFDWLQNDAKLAKITCNLYTSGFNAAIRFMIDRKDKHGLFLAGQPDQISLIGIKLLQDVGFQKFSEEQGDYPRKAVEAYLAFVHNTDPIEFFQRKSIVTGKVVSEGTKPAPAKTKQSPVPEKNTSTTLKGMFEEYLDKKYSDDMISAMFAGLSEVDGFLVGFKIVPDTIFNVSDFRLLSIAYESIHNDKAFRAKQGKLIRVIDLALKEYIAFFKGLPASVIDNAVPRRKVTTNNHQIQHESSTKQMDSLLEYCATMKMSYSYKPVLILALLKAGRNGSISVEKAAKYFRDYYELRREQGLPAEKKRCIYLRDDVTDKQIIANLMSNPVKALCESRFFSFEEEDRIFRFVPDIWACLDKKNQTELTQICNQRLKEYFSD